MAEVLLTAAGILLPSLLITLAIDQWIAPLDCRVVAGLLLLVLVVLARPIFTPDMPVVLEEVVRGYPYRGTFGDVRGKNPDTNDTVKQILPWMQVAREEILSARAPLWNRYSFSGYPLLANGQSAPFSPFFLLTLFVPLPKQLVAMAGLKLFFGLLFTYLFLKREGASVWASVFGSAVFALSIFQNVYLYYPLSSVTILFPAIAFAAVCCVRERSVRHVLLVGAVTAAILSAGHPESVIHCAIGVLVLLALERIGSPAGYWRGVGAAMLGALLGAAVASPAWFPVLLHALDSQRMLLIGEGGFRSPPYPLKALWVLFNPDGFGNPARGTWQWTFNYLMVASSYVGLLPLAFFPAALVSKRATLRDRLLAFFAIVLFLFAMNWSFVGHGANALFSWTANDRIRFIVIFLVAIVAARGVDRVRQHGARWEVAGASVVFAFALYVFLAKLGTTLSAVHAVGIVALVGFWIVFAVARSKVAAAAAVFTALELIVFNWPFNAMSRREYFRPSLSILDRIHAEAPAEPFRILGHDWVFLPNASAQYGLEDVRGSDPMAWRDYLEFFRLIQAPGQSFDVGRVQEIAHPAVAFLNVRYLLAEPNSRFGSPWRLVYSERNGELYRHEAPLPRFYTPATLVARSRVPLLQQLRAIDDFREAVIVDGARGRNRVIPGMWIGKVSPRRFRLTIDSPGRMFVASSQPTMPGWKVRVNGRPTAIYRVNGAFIGLFVPAGKVRVVVEYAPPSFEGPVAVSLLTILSMVGLAVWRRRRGSRAE